MEGGKMIKKTNLKTLLAMAVFLVGLWPVVAAGGTIYVDADAIPGEHWNQPFGGANWDFAYSVQQTSDGGYILAGTTLSYGAGNADFWLVKTDANGDEEFNQPFGGANWDCAYSVQQTSDGGYILAGETSSFGAGSDDFWLVKTDSNGNEEFNQPFGGSHYDVAYSVQQTSDGGYILAGYTNSPEAGDNDFWLVKTDANGNEEWNKTFGGASTDMAYSVQQTSDGGYILAGRTFSFGAGNSDFWLVKTDPNGNQQWSQTFGGSRDDTARSVQQTSDGGYILAGATLSYGAGNYDFWLVKTDSNGNEEWNKTFGGSDLDAAYSAQQTSDGGYILAGWTESFGAGQRDFWLVKTDSNGNEEWTQTFGGANWDMANSVQQTLDGGYIVVGYTDPCGTGNGNFWLVKLASKSSSWTNAYNYLQDALADANSDPNVDEIRVAQGIYTPDSNSGDPNGSGDREATFQLINGVAIYGGFATGGGNLEDRDPNAYETILSGDLNGDDVGDLPGPSKGDNSRHVVTGSGTDSTAVLDGFTITGGVARGTNGGGMYNYEGNPTVLNCTFIGNLALAWPGAGGGMYNYDSNPMVINCRFIGNSAEGTEGGGGMLNDWYSEPNIVNCTFRKNSTDGSGGGIHNYRYSSSRMTNCDISENTAHYGGGIACGSNDALTNCTISGNSADFGGGMLCTGIGTSPTLDGCIISGNSAKYSGGGMNNWWGSAPKLKNCTISGNSADLGGGVYNYQDSSVILTNCTISGNYGYYGGGICEDKTWSYIDTVVDNCILWGNEAVHGPEICRRDSYNYFLVSYSDVQGGQADIYNDSSHPVDWLSGNMDADPCFVGSGYWADANDPNIIVEPNDPNAVWVDGDYHLLPTSSCIDAGDPNYVPEPDETDIDGNPRVINGRIDMGAYESNYIQAAMKLTPQILNCNSKGKYIKAHLTLPEGFLPEDVDVSESAIAEPIGIESEYIKVFGNDDGPVRLEICFDRETFCDLLTDMNDGSLEITVIGSLTTSRYFYATDTIKIKP